MNGQSNEIVTQEMLTSELAKAYEMRVSDLDVSIKMVNDTLDTAIALKCPQLVANSKTLIGLFLMIKGDFEMSQKASYEALEYYKINKNRKGIADATFNLASTYYKTDNFHKGLLLLLECKQIYADLVDHANLSKVLKAIGTVYEYLGDLHNAKESYEESIATAIICNDTNLESNGYNPLSGIYLKQGMLVEAMNLSQKSIDLKILSNDERGLAYSYYSRGKVYLQLLQYKQAIADFNRSLSIQTKIGDRLGEGMCLNKLGMGHYQLEEFDRAILYLTKAQLIAYQYNIMLIQYKSSYTLYLVYKKMGDIKNAMHYLEEYNSQKDLVIKQKSADIISSYEAIFKLEMVQKEAQLQAERMEIIENKNQELDSFFYRVSHDLKGPIASLMGLHNLIILEGFEGEAKKYFDLYHTQFIRLNTIIMDLINLTKMNSIEDNKVEINFRQLTMDCVNSLVYLKNFENIEFHYEIEENLNYYSQWVIVNTILQNLIENAIKYSKEEGQSSVKIRIYRESNQLIIQVDDNGLGISKEDQDKVFDMFYRATRQAEGTGLGLYILKRAVERLHGQIRLNSELEVGTSFKVIIPY